MGRLLTDDVLFIINLHDGPDPTKEGSDVDDWAKSSPIYPKLKEACQYQDIETLKAVGRWLLKHPCPANPLKYDIRQRDLEALLRGERPEGVT